MMNPFDLNRTELIEELRKRTTKTTLETMLKWSTADLRGEYARVFSSEADKKYTPPVIPKVTFVIGADTVVDRKREVIPQSEWNLERFKPNAILFSSSDKKIESLASDIASKFAKDIAGNEELQKLHAAGVEFETKFEETPNGMRVIRKTKNKVRVVGNTVYEKKDGKSVVTKITPLRPRMHLDIDKKGKLRSVSICDESCKK